jgi:hypothetical protein
MTSVRQIDAAFSLQRKALVSMASMLTRISGSEKSGCALRRHFTFEVEPFFHLACKALSEGALRLFFKQGWRTLRPARPSCARREVAATS